MSDPSTRFVTPSDFAELARDYPDERALETVAQGSVSGDGAAPVRYASDAQASLGFSFLAEHGAAAIRAFKLLEAAHSSIGGKEDTASLSISEWKLLEHMLGASFLGVAAQAYTDCKQRTRRLDAFTQLDERARWRLNEFVHLYENVVRYGRRAQKLAPAQDGRLLQLLVRDFGEYFGLLCDDVDASQAAAVASVAKTLDAFRRSDLFDPNLTLDRMTRLPLSDDRVRALLDFEIARATPAHPLAVKECVIRGDESGQLADEDAVELNIHQISVSYAWDLDATGQQLVDLILPVLAVSAFDGFNSLAQAEAYIAQRREEMKTQERQCFVLLQCLKHYGGKVPPRMKAFAASEVMAAAQKVRKKKEKVALQPKASTLGGMLKETVSGAWMAVTAAVTFKWPDQRTFYQLPGYPPNLAFFPVHISVRSEGEPEEFTFLCHADRDVDADGDKPLFFEYQAVLADTLMFDAHAAAINGFANSPAPFKRTLAAGPLVVFAKDSVHPGERQSAVDLEEVKLLGLYVALDGGMRSWMGHHYLLSDAGADIFRRYPDVIDYVSRAAR